mgnify:FL=1
MHWRAIIRLFGLLLMFYSLSFLPSLIVSWIYSDGQWITFIGSSLIVFLLGLSLWLSNYHQRQELSVRDGFLVVTLFWFILGLVGALPFYLSLHLGFTDAVFESISGFTTTRPLLLG